MYCSDACRKRANRANAKGEALAARPTTTATAAPARTKSGRGLGTTAKTTDMQVSGLHQNGETDNPGSRTAKRD
ncbi:hypothetical protein ACFQ6O_47245, partial [Streptomyces sp. NPDC056441]|uniref:hypothetical protein n=1 Tax=Streptomyces sp. NPDC056441 TaxID=3345817 RepID=UPI0036C7C3CF